MIQTSWTAFCKAQAVHTRPIAFTALLCAAFLAVIVLKPVAVDAMTIYWGRHPQKERLVFRFDGTLSDYRLERTGRQQAVLFLEQGLWERESLPSQALDLSGARLLRSVVRRGDSVVINLRTDAFTLEDFILSDPNRVVVDIVQDQAGTSWRPPADDRASDTIRNEVDALASRLQEQAFNASESAPLPPEEVELPAPEPTAEGEPAPEPVQVPLERAPTPISTIRFPVTKVGPENPVTVPATAARQHEETLPQMQVEEQPPADAGAALEESTPMPAMPPQAEGNGSGEERKALPESSSLNASGAPDFRGLLVAAKAALINGELLTAKEQFELLAANENVPEKMRPEILFNLADVNYQLYQDDVANRFDVLVRSFETAINADPDSPRIPWALLHLGLVYLKAGNQPEALGYFNVLQNKYPDHPMIPVSHLAYGRVYLEQGAYQEAAHYFQHVTENYPESGSALPAAVGLATALKELGFYDQSFDIIQFVETRWPKHYLDEPDFLRLAGFVAQQLGKYDTARDHYWTNYNLEPEAPGADVVLTRLGDLYLLMDRKEAARRIYETAVEKFPDQEGGLVAKIRLAEEGIHDEPNIEQMFSIYDRPFNLRPKEVYTEIIEQHADSPVAPMARVKLGIWYVFRKKPLQALELAKEFLTLHPDNPLEPRMLDVARMAYLQYAVREIEEQNFERVVRAWNDFSFVQADPGSLAPQAVLATALSFWKTGEVNRAKNLAMPFLTGERVFHPESESALDLMLSIYLEGHGWQNIVELGERMAGQDMSEERRAQLRYAMALAYENLGMKDQSRELWQTLANDVNLSLEQQGFAYYFLAREALQRNDLAEVQVLAQRSLSALIQSGGDRAKALDLLDMLIAVTDASGRRMDALAWALDLEKQLSKDDPIWPAFRYKMASLYQRAGDDAQWVSLLEDLQKNFPNTLYGRMAASDLRDYRLRKEAGRYL